MQTLTDTRPLSNEEQNEVTYGGFWPRFLAFIIDSVVIGAGLLVLKLFALSGISGIEVLNRNILFSYSVTDIMYFIMKSAYFVICIHLTQTTVGKYLMRLKVVGKDGGKLNLLSVIYRETIGRFLSSILFVGYFLIVIDKEKAALHDRICDSRVIYACNVKKTVMIQRQMAPPPIYPGGMNGQPYHGGMQNQQMPPHDGMQNQQTPPHGGMQNQQMPPHGGMQNQQTPSYGGMQNQQIPPGSGMQQTQNQQVNPQQDIQTGSMENSVPDLPENQD